jgi:hypothetical protein
LRINFNTKSGLTEYNGRLYTGISRNSQEIILDNWYSGAWNGPGGSWRYAQYYIDGLGLTVGNSIAILAYDDYGSSAARLRLLGYNARPCNPSTYVQSVQSTPEDTEIMAELTTKGFIATDSEWSQVMSRFSSGGARAKLIILNEEGLTNPSRNNIKSALGVTGGNNNITWMIIETHLECFENSEVQSMSTEYHKFANNVAWLYADADQLRSWVVARGDLNRQNTAAWRALLPNDYLIRGSDGQVSVP